MLSKTPTIWFFLANHIVAILLLRLAGTITHGQTINIFERVQLIFLNYRRTRENKTLIYLRQKSLKVNTIFAHLPYIYTVV